MDLTVDGPGSRLSTFSFKYWTCFHNFLFSLSKAMIFSWSDGRNKFTRFSMLFSTSSLSFIGYLNLRPGLKWVNITSRTCHF